MKKSLLAIVILFVFVLSCDTKKKSERSIHRDDFGTMPDGTAIGQYALTNANGIEMKVITYGGIITSLKLPDRDGNFADVVLGYDNLEGYLKQNPYFGAIIGRYGNRIAKGLFTLDSIQYKLAQNNIGNHLHGGNVGFDKVVWSAEPLTTADAVGLKLTYRSKDMEEGYPGNLDITVHYILSDDNTLTFEYFATTDKKTVVNLTNHAYYNLTGKSGDILGHELMINAKEYLPVDSTLIPLQPESVQGTPFDFVSAKTIGKDIRADHVQLKNGNGYDHCWILNKSQDPLNFAASLYDPGSGRLMEISTTEPGIQFYSGNFLDGTITGKGGVIYNFRTGLCLETQHYPDSPNRSEFPTTTLNPGEEYRSKTVTKFSVK
ncbi:MAG TPA: aldose epimerase family protein [Cyclobacteriaceae bacterium]|nr:aldose epimerase family protein [Cyclobacteriaceae bacterium]